MGVVEIAIIIIVSVAFVAAVSYVIYRKVKHKGGCDCGCAGCPHSGICRKDKEKN